MCCHTMHLRRLYPQGKIQRGRNISKRVLRCFARYAYDDTVNVPAPVVVNRFDNCCDHRVLYNGREFHDRVMFVEIPTVV